MLKSMAVLQFLPNGNIEGIPGNVSSATVASEAAPITPSAGDNIYGNLYSKASAHLLSHCLNDMGVSDLSDIVWAYASVGIHDDALFEAAAVRLLDGLVSEGKAMDVHEATGRRNAHHGSGLKATAVKVSVVSPTIDDPPKGDPARADLIDVSSLRWGFLGAWGAASKDTAGANPPPSPPPSWSRSCRAAGGLLDPSLGRHNPMMPLADIERDEPSHALDSLPIGTMTGSRGDPPYEGMSLDPESLTKVRHVYYAACGLIIRTGYLGLTYLNGST